MSPLAYVVVDVFTTTPFAGNPLAVVFGAHALETGQLQALAMEFNLSETVFVLPPTVPGATYRARIFTPGTELPFAGHPSIGAAVTQVNRGLFPPGPVVQECRAGLMPITVTGVDAAVLTGGEPTIGPELDPGPLLAGVGLHSADHVGPPPRVAGCGLAFPYLGVRSDAVGRAKLIAGGDIDHLSVFAWDPASATARARVFAPGSGVVEDPATGSAALGFGVWLVASGLLAADGTSRYTIHQGVELGRPSLLLGEVTAESGVAISASVSGHVVHIASGEIAVPPRGC